MTTIDEVMLLADAYADAEVLFWRVQDKPVNQIYTQSRIERNRSREALMTALEALITESQREIAAAKDDAAFLISQKLKEAQQAKSTSWMDCEGVPV
jgi:hypothetical protein